MQQGPAVEAAAGHCGALVHSSAANAGPRRAAPPCVRGSLPAIGKKVQALKRCLFLCTCSMLLPKPEVDVASDIVAVFGVLRLHRRLLAPPVSPYRRAAKATWGPTAGCGAGEGHQGLEQCLAAKVQWLPVLPRRPSQCELGPLLSTLLGAETHT